MGGIVVAEQCLCPGKLTIGFPNGQTYNSSRYINDEAWLTEDRLWPGAQEFKSNSEQGPKHVPPPPPALYKGPTVFARPQDGNTTQALNSSY
eukprot:5033820-Amphidinium_carterae.1